jgi:predicted RNase H-like nuclease (RuvC/YqgF family)
MLTKGRVAVLPAAAILLAIGTAFTQDSPSLGDLARKQRQHNEATDKSGKPVKVITNEQIPEHPAAAIRQARAEESSDPHYDANVDRGSAGRWKSQILTQKNQVANLQREIEDLNESIRFAPANCAANCVGWNERQREKQLRVERMRAQLDEQKKRLDEMQDSARRAGFGSSVYDP